MLSRESCSTAQVVEKAISGCLSAVSTVTYSFVLLQEGSCCICCDHREQPGEKDRGVLVDDQLDMSQQ